MADDGDPVDVEYGEQVPHAVGVGGHGIVRPRLVGKAMPEKVRSDDGVIAGERINHGEPRTGGIANAVDQEQGRPISGREKGPTVAMDGEVAVLDVTGTFVTSDRADRSAVHDVHSRPPSDASMGRRIATPGALIPFYDA